MAFCWLGCITRSRSCPDHSYQVFKLIWEPSTLTVHGRREQREWLSPLTFPLCFHLKKKVPRFRDIRYPLAP